MAAPVKSRRADPVKSSRSAGWTNPLYWAIAAVLGGAAATYAYVKSGPTLDKGVSPQERQAIRYAFTNEKDPKNLRNFARSLLPSFPLAATALASKATMLTPFKKGMGTAAASAASATQQAPANPVSPLGAFVPKTGTRVSGIAVGNILDDIASVPSTLADTASDIGNVLIHPADTASGAWKIVTHPADSITDFGNALVDALHAIPGMDEAGELLKKFAHWCPLGVCVGEWCLRVLATYGYYVMAPYLGAQLAAVSFALPGSVKAEPFITSWIKETISRFIATAAILLPGIGIALAGAASGALSEATNKFLAENPEFQRFVKEMTDQIGKASETLVKDVGSDLAKKLQDGVEGAVGDIVKKLGAKYGLPPDFSKIAREASGAAEIATGNGLTVVLSQVPVREDNAAAAYDQLAKTNYQGTTKWDPITGEDILAHLAKARFQSVQNVSKTALTNVYKDPRTMSVQEAVGRRNIAVADLINPPERVKWVRLYLNEERLAKTLAKAPPASGATAPAVGFDPAFGGASPGFQHGLLAVPGGYLVEFESQYPGGAGVPELFRYNGVRTAGMRQIGPNRYRIFVHTSRPFQLRNLAGLRWLISRRFQ